MAGVKLDKSKLACEHLMVTKIQKEVVFELAEARLIRNSEIVKLSLIAYIKDLIAITPQATRQMKQLHKMIERLKK